MGDATTAGSMLAGAAASAAARAAIADLAEVALAVLAPEVVIPVLAAVVIGAAIGFAMSKVVGETKTPCDNSEKDGPPAAGPQSESGTATSPSIDPSEVAGKTPAEIDEIANKKGLIPKGPDPKNGKGAYIDPVTGEQRILSHPDAEPPHAHVNDPSGGRLDINGNPVEPESPDAHLPLGGQ